MSVRKRKNNNGSISYVAVIDAPRDAATGKRRQIKRSFRTKRDAEQWEREQRLAMDKGLFIDPNKQTVSEHMKYWLESIKLTVRTSTFERYSGIVHHRVIPELGSIQLVQLGPLHVQHWNSSLLRAGLSPTTVALYHNVLHRALDQAVKWQMLPRNVCDAVEAPRAIQPEIQTWTLE